MAITTNSLFDKRSNQIEEILNRNIEVFLPAYDPVFRDTIVSSLSQIPSAQLGRDLKMIRLFQMGFAGVLEPSAPRGDFTLYGDKFQPLNNANNSHLLVSEQAFTGGALQTFPDAMESPEAMTFRLGITLRGLVGNLKMHMSHLQAEATPAFIGQVIAPMLEGFSRNIAHTMCNYWYVDQNTDYRLCLSGTPTIASVTGVSGATSTLYSIKFAPDNLAVDRFFVGQRVDWYAVSGGAITNRKNDQTSLAATQTTATRIPLYVHAVDEMAGTVTLISPTNPTGWAGDAGADPTSGDAIIPANSAVVAGGGAAVATGFHGMNSWMKFGSSAGSTPALDRILGADADASNYIDVNKHPQFKSFLKAHGGSAMTEHSLRKYVRGYNRAKAKYGGFIDCLIASDGVWLAMEGTKIGREVIDRTGRLSSLKSEGSEDGMSFTFDGRTLMGYTSNYVESGTIYGIKKGGGNWKRVVPPSVPGTVGMDNDNFAPYEFVGQVLGGNGTKVPIYQIVNGRNLMTEAVQMPGTLRMQLVPDYPCGMKITGVGEDRSYSDLGG